MPELQPSAEIQYELMTQDTVNTPAEHAGTKTALLTADSASSVLSV